MFLQPSTKGGHAENNLSLCKPSSNGNAGVSEKESSTPAEETVVVQTTSAVDYQLEITPAIHPQKEFSGDCPLSTVNELIVKKKCNLIKCITGYITHNKYEIMDGDKVKMYTAVESGDCCWRNLISPYHRFDMKVKDNNEEVIIQFRRHYSRCVHKVEVVLTSSPDTVVGYVEQEGKCCHNGLLVKNSSGDIVARIMEPCYLWLRLCNDVTFTMVRRRLEK
ncbi:phospholipid scramblase 2-like isoform X2 [Galleria mellonella]|uniref:Phospholipid scramblase n=1 Tax=Galleria mellonella TaxID=7137 RepID=A0A6J3BYE0_GALME|nr:phospholipid scramblase 2-like isoform X2 [Galleria mellonella]